VTNVFDGGDRDFRPHFFACTIATIGEIGVMKRIVRTDSDIAEIEREGFSAFLPHASPFDVIQATAARYPDKPAIRYITQVGAPETDVTLNYRDFAGRIRQAANLFRRLGVTKTDAVAILAPHVLSTQIALWAAEVAGRACPINPMLAPDHIVGLLRAANARIAIVLGENGDLDIWPRLVPSLR
jgi:fatty-acyl-CoA synthase